MALMTLRGVQELDGAFVLAPERYDPRREHVLSRAQQRRSVTLGSVVGSVRQTVNPAARSAHGRRCVVLDTSDVREGIIVGRKTPLAVNELGSQKKVFEPNDVLISRLRPYLRQVAFVDGAFAAAEQGLVLVCSTEFFVLRSLTGESIAFLAPYLLSEAVQTVLAASQEGGHHPRFDEATLLNLPIPDSILRHRMAASQAVEQSVAWYRQSELSMVRLVNEAGAAVAA